MPDVRLQTERRAGHGACRKTPGQGTFEPAGQVFHLGIAHGTDDLSLGPLGSLLIDAGTLLHVASGVTPGELVLTVPGSAGLVGEEFFAQALSLGVFADMMADTVSIDDTIAQIIALLRERKIVR